MKVNFPLEDIELNIEDDILEVSESLLQQGNLRNLNEIEKGLWTGSFTENSVVVEVEVQIAGSRVRGYTCECDVFKRYGVCQHIAATLHALRERRRRFAEDREKARLAKLKKIETEKNPQLLTVSHILKHAEKEALLSFVADYARQNKQFSLALKTRFTGTINKENNEINYKILIDNTLKNAKTPKGNITPKGWGEILTVVDQLRQQSETAAEQDDLQQVFILTSLILPFLHRLLRREDVPKSKIVKRQEIFVNLLRGGLGRPMAKELEQKIYAFVFNEFQTQIRFDFIDFFANNLLPPLLKNTNRHEKILEIIDNNLASIKKINQLIVHYRDEAKEALYNRLVGLKIRVVQYAGQAALAAKIIIENNNTGAALLDAIHFAFEQEDTKLLKILLEKGLLLYDRTPFMTHIEEFALKLAIVENDRDKIIKFAKKLIINTLKSDFYHILIAQKISTAEKETLLSTINNLPHSIEKRDLLGMIFFEEGMYDNLFAFIRHLQSFELLRLYSIRLWQVEPQKTIELNEEVLLDYLVIHFGKLPAQRVKTLFESYIEMGGIDFVKIMAHFLRKKFAQRGSLLEELDLLELDDEKN